MWLRGRPSIAVVPVEILQLRPDQFGVRLAVRIVNLILRNSDADEMRNATQLLLKVKGA
jgi:hypothetical protein